MNAPSEQLLSYLRARLGGGIEYVSEPVRLTGGFDTTTMAFRVSGGPAEFDRDLILRILPQTASVVRLRREAVTQAALVASGFPAPRILISEEEHEPFGNSFLIMERLAGQNMWSSAVGPRGRKSRLLSMPRRLAEAHAMLHRVDGTVLSRAAVRAGLDPAVLTVAGEIQRIRIRIENAHLEGLREGVAWLQRNMRRPLEPEVVCHGDFHPLNLMVDGEKLTGVIDWPQAIVAEPAYDVAATRILLGFADAGLTGLNRAIFDVVRHWAVARYLDTYRQLRPFRDANMLYFEALRVLSALTYAGEHPAGPRNPWRKPHTLAVLYRHFEMISGVAVRL
jgi:aminoglycoside phosphotransferase (APT) family kinase protein